MSNVNHDTTAIINALIKYFRENDLRIHGELANDTNIFTGAVSSVDAKQYALLVFVGTNVVLVLRDIGDDFAYLGKVYVSSTVIVHSVENYQRIAFGKDKRGMFPVELETFAQRVFESVTKLTEHNAQEIMAHCLVDILCHRAVQNLVRVGFISPDQVLKVIDAHLRQALKMLPYKNFVYVATTDMTNVLISRQKNMQKDVTKAIMVEFKAGAK